MKTRSLPIHCFKVSLLLCALNCPTVSPASDKGVAVSEDFYSDQVHSLGPIAFNTEYSKKIVNWQQYVTEKPYHILQQTKLGGVKSNALTVSGAVWGTWMHEQTNVAGKFPILSRFPDQHGSVDTEADRWILNNAALALTGRVGDWVTLFAQGEFSDIEFIGQDQYQVRKALVMIGNLEKFPLYTYFGRNTVDFGFFDAYNPFTHSVNNHSFRVDSDDPILAIGYAPQFIEGLNFVATAIPGGRHLRVADSDGSGQFDNYAANLTYRAIVNDDTAIRVGAGWLNSTIYNTEFPHHPGPSHGFSLGNATTDIKNGAWDVNAELRWRKFSIAGEFTTTQESWPSTGERVTALTGQFAYDFDLFGKPTRFSYVYGVNYLGPDDTEYEQLKQIAVGLETEICPNFQLGIEYVRNSAFVPLIAITQASDASVRTDTVIAGGKLTF
tara:strand:- start:1699 stop:3018 length:1320 start_codon:yes stop_codon:yes gene_type:complete